MPQKIETGSYKADEALTKIWEIINFYNSPEISNKIQKDLYLKVKMEIEKISEELLKRLTQI